MVISGRQLERMRAAVNARLPDTCAIQARSTTSDGAGGVIETWQTVEAGTVACRVDPLTLRDEMAINQGRETVRTLMQLTVPYDAPIDDGERVEVNGEAWEIVSRSDSHSWRASRRAVISRIEPVAGLD